MNGKIPTPPPKRPKKIQVVQKRKEQIQAANGECTRIAAGLGALDLKEEKLEAEMEKLKAEKRETRKQLHAAFDKRNAALESAGFDHDIDLKKEPWSFNMETGTFEYGQPNLAAMRAMPAPSGVEVVDMTPLAAAPEEHVLEEPPVVVPRGGGSFDD